ncbi:Acetyl esterase/lipase [Amycolatopsis xylanica]|uniref:Acetyl esterase/lipase n=1 Tax=Amycolatopsis xylanica TaxID=589385 RepID=A0A1H3AYJ1_9PSEU|nr:dienelactone hydrolase family protein [Amycolatopsis xylanica]SDX34655.1 Acetyl esterase/lipase [Amycolatopsis xylanica]
MPFEDVLKPFVIEVEPTEPERHGAVDLYLPDADGPRPAIVFVHGGPVAPEQRPTPRDWPVFRGYGSLSAAKGVVAAVVDHRLHAFDAYPTAAEDVAAAVELVRADPRVDPNRIAVWFFSGGGLLSAEWLRAGHGWLRCVAANYPLLATFPGWEIEPRFRPVEAVGESTLPIVLVRVGLERPEIAAGVAAFVEAAGANLEIVDVPNGQHSFDLLDHTDESRKAVELAFDKVLAALG